MKKMVSIYDRYEARFGPDLRRLLDSAGAARPWADFTPDFSGFKDSRDECFHF
jgi:hypothetical protein